MFPTKEHLKKAWDIGEYVPVSHDPVLYWYCWGLCGDLDDTRLDTGKGR